MNLRAMTLQVAALTIVVLTTPAHAEPSTLSEGARQAGRELGSAAKQGGHVVAQAGRDLGAALRNIGHSIAHAAKEGARGVKQAIK